MTDAIPEGEFDSTFTLNQARKIYARFKQDLQRVIDAVSTANLNADTAKEISGALAHHQKALLQLQTLEAELEKRGDITGALRATQLDLRSARTEVIDRVIRIQERSGD